MSFSLEEIRFWLQSPTPKVILAHRCLSEKALVMPKSFRSSRQMLVKLVAGVGSDVVISKLVLGLAAEISMKRGTGDHFT